MRGSVIYFFFPTIKWILGCRKFKTLCSRDHVHYSMSALHIMHLDMNANSREQLCIRQLPTSKNQVHYRAN